MNDRAAHAEHARARRRPGVPFTWLLRTTASRTRAQWRLLLAVIAVAVVAASLVTSLGLLVSATEQGGVSTALGEIPKAQRTMEVILVSPTINAAEARAVTDDGIAQILGDAGTAAGMGTAISDYVEVPAAGLPVTTLTYFGEYDGLMDHTTLVEGEWASGEGDVTIPAAGAEALGLEVGDEFTIRTISGRAETLTIEGLFSANDRDEDFWIGDPLHGEGNIPDFPDPNVTYYSPTNTLGPLVGPPGSLDEPRWIAIDYLPDFSTATVDGIEPLLDRLDSADIDLSRATASASSGTFYSSDVGEAVSGVTSSLVVTRSTVVVVSLLLVVLALAAMAQTARLFTEARDGERQLMRSRGASERHLLALGSLEAVFIGVVTALVSPLVANLVYRALAAQPALVAARMPADAGIPPITWATGAAVALLFVIVLLLPQLGRARTFVAGEQARGRPRVASGIMRSGLDVVLVIIAGLAFWQLRSYQSPVDTSEVSLEIDPILAAGPALMLLAAGLVCVRLIPTSSRLLQRLGARRRGAVASLAAWEIGRRSQRATAAVLLLSLTLAVGTFGLAFLDTWKQSQVDQAQLAVGAPARASGDDTDASSGGIGNAEPVIRRSGMVGYSTGQAGSEVPGGATAQVLGLSDGARDLAARGRLADQGGLVIAALSPDADESTGVELGEGATLTATVRVGSDKPLPGVSAGVVAVVEDAQGVLSASDPVSVVVDGSEHPVEWALPAGSTRLVALQARFGATDLTVDPVYTDDTTATLLVKDLANGAPLEVPDSGWAPADRSAWLAPEAGWQFGLGMAVPASVQIVPASFALIGWIPLSSISAVLTETLAEQIGATSGAALTIFSEGSEVRVYVAKVVPVVPGTAATTDLTSSINNAAAASAIIVDQTLLARAYIEQGTGPVSADEWWVDVAPGSGAAYERAHEGSRTAEVLATELQEAPLRVGTQAALWLAIIAGAVLAAMGFAAHSIATLRARRLELAQLRAIGFSRRRLVSLLATESLIMSGLGTIFGVGIGLVLVWLVGPLVAVSPSGTPPVPSVELHVPWFAVLLLVVEIVVVLGLIVVAVARVQRFVEPAALLREGSAQ